jgi:serine protease Do
LSFAPIVRAADPGVVTVQTIGEAEGTGGRRRRRSLRGLGTGFVIDTSGLVLTNNHVIEGAESIEVRVTEDREVPASVVARDPPTDIAVLRIKAEGLVALPFGDSDELAVGDWVVAIGNPFELSHTVSVGIVSAKGRTRDDVPLDPSGYYDFLQTDASINPGNSGGPLLDLRGQVVGMNTAIRGGGAQGIGFAIPINMVRKLLPQLVRDGRITRSALGVKMRDLRELPPEERAQLKLIAAGGGPPKGAIVEHVNPGSGAEKGGIRVGDVIVGFDGTTIERGTHLQWLASMAGVGRSVAVSLVRGGAPLEVRVTLGQLALPPHVAPKGPAE